jgi:hypothetical protein
MLHALASPAASVDAFGAALFARSPRRRAKRPASALGTGIDGSHAVRADRMLRIKDITTSRVYTVDTDAPADIHRIARGERFDATG